MGEPSDVYFGKLHMQIEKEGLTLDPEINLDMRQRIQLALTNAGYFSQGMTHQFGKNLDFQVRPGNWNPEIFEGKLDEFALALAKNAKARGASVVETVDLEFAIRLGIWPFT